MKSRNKKAEQIEAKRLHRERLKASRRSGSVFERPAPVLTEKPLILIVCEGQNTEPSYFNQFRLSSATIKSVGEGYNTVSLVNRAMKLAEEATYDQVWCVFDADPKPGNPTQAPNFNAAIPLAESKGYGVAYSNQAFEYWFILHFDDHQGGAMERRDYNDKINKLIGKYGVTYDGEKSKKVSEKFFELLDGIDEKTGLERKELATRRAERNYKLFDHTNPAKEESSTTVFRLVREILKYT